MAITIGEPQDLADFEKLQLEVWGCPAADVVPTHLLQAHLHHGACLLGAWKAGFLVGFVYAFPGPRGTDYLYSHLAAVAPALQGQGLGRLLKLAQADWARAHGYRRIVWTFDPLQAANARLNLGILGATCQRYLVNYYGELDDDLNRGQATDRLEVDWWLHGVDRRPGGLNVHFPWPLQADSRGHWREITRARFVEAFSQGLSVTGFAIQDGMATYQLGVVTPLAP